MGSGLSKDLCNTHFFLFNRKKGYINLVPKSVHLSSVCLCVCANVRFLVNVSPPKPLDKPTSNFTGA